MAAEKKSKPITKADLKPLATTKDLQGLAVRMGSLEGDLKSFHSEFRDFKDWTQTTLDRILKNTETLKQEITVLRSAQMKRLHERLQRLEKKTGLPVEEYL